MTVNLRVSLTIFKIGFAVEAAGAFLILLTGGTYLPAHGYLLLLSPIFSGIGILFLWIGRHEWNATHHRRSRYANVAFFGSLLAIALVAAPIAYLALQGIGAASAALEIEFGAAVALVFGITFLTYAFVAAHLVSRAGAIAMGLGLGWALLLSALIGLTLSPKLRPIVQQILERSPSVASLTQSITFLEALLGFSYLAFFVAFADAHYRVARGAPGPAARA